MQKINKTLNNFIGDHFNLNLQTDVIGFARSLLGTSLLLTLLFNKVDVLYPSIDYLPANSQLHILAGFNRINFFLLLGFSNLSIMKLVAIVALLLVVIGLFPRYTCIFHWWIQYSFISSSSAVDGGDQIAANISLLMIPICLFDNRIWHWRNIQEDHQVTTKKMFLSFCFKLIRIQVAAVYLHSAVGKLKVEEWLNGTAMYYWLNSTFFKMPNWLEPVLNPLLKFGVTVTILTWATIIFELILFSSLVIEKRYRNTILICAMIFHFMIMILFGLVSFFFSISGALILYLRPVDSTFNFSRYFSRVNNGTTQRFAKNMADFG